MPAARAAARRLLLAALALAATAAAVAGRALAQEPAPPAADNSLVAALGSIQGDLGAAANATEPGGNATEPGGNATTPAAGAGAPPPPDGGSGPGPCTDPALLGQTMDTFCRLGSLDELRNIAQSAVQACCRLTSATLQPNCWDACAPPPAASEQVLNVLKLWRNICLVNTPVTCEEGPRPAGGGG